MVQEKKGFSDTIVAHAPDSLIATNEAGIIVIFNEAAECLLGYTTEEILGKNISFLLPELTKAEIEPKGKPHVDRVLVRCKDGTNVLVEVSVQACQYGGKTYYIHLLHRCLYECVENQVSKVSPDHPLIDETSLSYVANHKNNTLEQLLAEKSELESIIDSIADAIIVIDPAGVVLRANRATHQIFGWTEEELIGKTSAVVPAHLWEEALMLYEQVMTGKSIIGWETIRQRKDGSMFEASITYSPICNAQGEVVAIASIFRDITLGKRTDEFLRNSYKLSVIGEMAAGIAHEIRNPLTSLRGFVQLMKADDMKNLVYLDIMLSELDRINGIVSELLLLAKPQTVQFHPHDLKTLLSNVVTLLETQAIISNVQIFTEFLDDQAYIICEENQMKQVLINISKNAIEAMPQGGVVTIRVSKENSQVVIAIEDQGYGIPSELIPRLGEPFYTTKPKGTGLGLMVSNKIIREHQGIMLIESELNKGTTVTIRLPFAHPN